MNGDPQNEERNEPYPGGYCLFPEMPEEFFKQLTSEVLEIGGVKAVRGKSGAMKRRRRPEWVPTRARNEALDTRIYARAAASQFGMDRFGERHWQRLESMVGAGADHSTSLPSAALRAGGTGRPAPPTHTPQAPATPAAKPTAPRRRVIRSRFLNR